MQSQSRFKASILSNKDPNPLLQPSFPHNNAGRLGRPYVNQRLSGLDVVAEDKPWESSAVGDELGETDVSSLGDASDDSVCACEDECEGASEGWEAQSSYKGPLDCLNSLEASLPIKKGLSQFYSGKSRSFTCLTENLSVRDIAKPENPYNRRRKSFTAYGNSLDKLRFCAIRTSSGISKKSFHGNKNTLALAVTMRKEGGTVEVHEHECRVLGGTCSGCQINSARARSFSLSDLQGTGCQYSL